MSERALWAFPEALSMYRQCLAKMTLKDPSISALDVPPEERMAASECACGWRGVPVVDRDTKDSEPRGLRCPRCRKPVEQEVFSVT